MGHEPKSAEARLESFRDEFPVHERVRNRREIKGLTGAELAKRSGVSPAYVSLIERGRKVPAEEVAVAIARSLDDDPELYRHWARAGRYPTSSEARRRYDAISADAHLRRSLAAGDDLSHRINLLQRVSMAARPTREQEDASAAIAVPVLPEGLDPGRTGAPLPATADVLWLDARLLPRQGRSELFAYLASEAGSVGGVLEPGGFLVMSRRVRPVVADRIYAIRLGPRIALRRVVLKKNVLLLLPLQAGGDFEAISVESARAGLDRLAAASVLAVRRWY